MKRINGLLDAMDRRVWILCACRLLGAIGYSISVPFISAYMYTELGAPMTLIGLALMLSEFCAAGSQSVGGALSDRFGRKAMILFTSIGKGAAFVCMFFVILSARSFAGVMGCFAAYQIFTGFGNPSINAIVGEVVEAKKRVEAYSWLRIAGNSGFTIGPSLGGMLAGRAFHMLILTTAIINFAYVGVIIALLHDPISPRPAKESDAINGLNVALGSLASDRTFSLFVVCMVFSSIVSQQLMTTLSVFSISFVGLDMAQMGIVYGLNGTMVVFLQMPIAKVIKSWRLTHSLAIGSAIYAFGYMLIGFSKGFTDILGAMAMITMGELMVSPSSLALASQIAPAEKRGTYMGIYGLFADSGSSIAPFIGGSLLDMTANRPIVLWSAIASMDIAAALGFVQLDGWLQDSPARLVGDGDGG